MIPFSRYAAAAALFVHYLPAFARWAVAVVKEAQKIGQDGYITPDEAARAIPITWPLRDAYGNPLPIKIPRLPSWLGFLSGGK